MDIVCGLKIADTVLSITKTIIADYAPRLQNYIKGFAERLLELSEKYPSLSDFGQKIDKVADVMGDILYALGINVDSAETIGAKTIQAEKKAEDFDSIEAYITYLKNEIELDKEKFNSISEEEKMAYKITGLALESKAIGEKLGVNVSAEAMEMFTKILDSGKFTINTDEIVSFITKIKSDGITNLNDICDYINGKGESNRIKTGENVLNALDSIHSGEGSAIVNELIDQIRE